MKRKDKRFFKSQLETWRQWTERSRILYERCLSEEGSTPLSDKLGVSHADVALIAQKLEEYFCLLRDECKVHWEGGENVPSVKADSQKILDFYEKVLELGENPSDSELLKIKQIETRTNEGMNEIDCISDKKSQCKFAFNNIEIERKAAIYGEGKTPEEACKAYIEEIRSLDGWQYLALNNNQEAYERYQDILDSVENPEVKSLSELNKESEAE